MTSTFITALNAIKKLCEMYLLHLTQILQMTHKVLHMWTWIRWILSNSWYLCNINFTKTLLFFITNFSTIKVFQKFILKMFWLKIEWIGMILQPKLLFLCFINFIRRMTSLIWHRKCFTGCNDEQYDNIRIISTL